MSPDASTPPCARCGKCKALCPTYSEDVNEGMSARGRVMLAGKFAAGEIGPSELLDKRMFSCLLCGACNSLCPLGINITDVISESRRELRDFSRKRRLLNFAAKLAFKDVSTGVRILKVLEVVGDILPVQRFQPFSTIKRLGLKLPGTTLRDGMSIFKGANSKGRIAMFAGCTVNFLYTHLGRSLINSLNALQYDVILQKGEVCCGAPLLGLGLEEEAAELAKRNLSILKKLKVQAVISLCPTCVSVIRDGYKTLIGEGIDNAVDVASFFGDRLADFPVLHSAMRPQPTTIYHDSCHAKYLLNITEKPRNILRSMGFTIADTEGGCCGFGGSFSFSHEELSESILEKRAEEYKQADMIVTSCPNCVLQLKSRLKDKAVKHIIELIEEALKGDKNGKEKQKFKQTRTAYTPGIRKRRKAAKNAAQTEEKLM